MVNKVDSSFGEDNSINIRGARQHNLKNIDLSLPRNKFIVFTGVSVSGKSLFSLVELIKEISKNQQVLCITHQPFLAAKGLAHFKVNKNVINGLTYTSIAKLTTKNQRKNELIELIGGSSCEVNEYASRLLDRPAA